MRYLSFHITRAQSDCFGVLVVQFYVFCVVFLTILGLFVFFSFGHYLVIHFWFRVFDCLFSIVTLLLKWNSFFKRFFSIIIVTTPRPCVCPKQTCPTITKAIPLPTVECPTAIQTTTKPKQTHTTSTQLQGNCGALLRKLHNTESKKSSRLSGGKGKYVNEVSNNIIKECQIFICNRPFAHSRFDSKIIHF